MEILFNFRIQQEEISVRKKVFAEQRSRYAGKEKAGAHSRKTKDSRDADPRLNEVSVIKRGWMGGEDGAII